MTRAEILAQAIADAWRAGHPDGLLFRAYLEETGESKEDAARIEMETRPYG